MTRWTHDPVAGIVGTAFEGRCLKCNKPLEDHPEHPSHFAGDTSAIETSRSRARRIGAQRDGEIRDRVRDYFAAVLPAVSLTIEHGGLFFAVDRELTVSQPFATEAAAQAMADRMGEEIAKDRRAESTKAAAIRFAQATIQYAKDPARVAQARARLAELER
jgi:hypothetical protein